MPLTTNPPGAATNGPGVFVGYAIHSACIHSHGLTRIKHGFSRGLVLGSKTKTRKTQLRTAIGSLRVR